jgi:ABC-type branched-subunit amino acid transport system permease subunit
VNSTTVPLLLLFLATAAAITAYAAIFLHAENQWLIAALIALGIAAVWAAAKFGLLRRLSDTHRAHPRWLPALAIAGVIALAGVLREDHFALLMIATTLLYSVVCWGLSLQFGHAGVVNFAGAAFFGTGAYATAVLAAHTALPHWLIVLTGGLVAALLGSLLILPVLRTRGHYAALITIAFGILFKTFLEVNDTLGGPQGLKLPGLQLFGWHFNDNIVIGTHELSFYLAYIAAALLLAIIAFVLVRRLEHSWIGLNFDAVRLDELAAASFGINAARWKITAFTTGNFLAGLAGGVQAMMLGFIAPNNFTLSDSLIMLSIILLGGLGSVWGVPLGAAIVLILPEKLQVIQEYRFLLFAILVIAVLLTRPQGLIPRALRKLSAAPR